MLGPYLLPQVLAVSGAAGGTLLGNNKEADVNVGQVVLHKGKGQRVN